MIQVRQLSRFTDRSAINSLNQVLACNLSGDFASYPHSSYRNKALPSCIEYQKASSQGRSSRAADAHHVS
jgi:hypothetical protein